MAFINFGTKKDSDKCFTCKFKEMNYFELNKKGYLHLLEVEPGVQKVLQGTLATICNMCPYKSKFEKVYGKAPIDYFVK